MTLWPKFLRTRGRRSWEAVVQMVQPAYMLLETCFCRSSQADFSSVCIWFWNPRRGLHVGRDRGWPGSQTGILFKGLPRPSRGDVGIPRLRSGSHAVAAACCHCRAALELERGSALRRSLLLCKRATSDRSAPASSSAAAESRLNAFRQRAHEAQAFAFNVGSSRSSMARCLLLRRGVAAAPTQVSGRRAPLGPGSLGAAGETDSFDALI